MAHLGAGNNILQVVKTGANVGFITLSTDSGTLTDEQYSEVIKDVSFLKRLNYYYEKICDNGSKIWFQNISGITENSLKVNLIIVVKSSKAYSKTSYEYVMTQSS